MNEYDPPELAGNKNRDLAIWALDMKEIIRIHNEDKRALRRWKSGIEGEGREE